MFTKKVRQWLGKEPSDKIFTEYSELLYEEELYPEVIIRKINVLKNEKEWEWCEVTENWSYQVLIKKHYLVKNKITTEWVLVSYHDTETKARKEHARILRNAEIKRQFKPISQDIVQ
jgi:hypothetical protein